MKTTYQWPNFFYDTIIPYHQTMVAAISAMYHRFSIRFKLGRPVKCGQPDAPARLDMTEKPGKSVGPPFLKLQKVQDRSSPEFTFVVGKPV